MWKSFRQDDTTRMKKYEGELFMTKEKNLREDFEEEEFDDDIEEDEYEEDEDEEDEDEEEDEEESGLSLDFNCRENVIEFLKNQNTITVTFSQRRWINKVKKMEIKYPDLVKIIAENDDKSIVAHLPIKALHLYITKSTNFIDEQREEKKYSSLDLNCKENVIEFTKNQKTMTVMFSQKKWITKVKKIAKIYPDLVKIIVENHDKCIVACLPVKALHLYISKPREFTDEQREQMSKRMSERLWDKNNNEEDV